jgi:hypothetical protein
VSCKLGFGGDDVNSNDKDDGDVSFARDIERVSISSVGILADGDSEEPSISSDGFMVAFISEATNLVPGDTNDAQDVFVHDLATGITERVSVASAGTQGDDDASTLSLSSNGSFVAFGSFATNLVAGDTNDVIDVFVHDRDTGTTTRVSIATDGTQANDESFSPAISSSGRFVAFRSDATNLVANDTNNDSDIFVRDRASGVTRRVSVDSDGDQANGDSILPAISADGRFVAFSSEASNLVGGDTNNLADIFVHDRQNDETVLIVGPAEFSTGSGIIIVAPSTVIRIIVSTRFWLTAVRQLQNVPAFQPAKQKAIQIQAGLRSVPTIGLWSSHPLQPTWFPEIPMGLKMFLCAIGMRAEPGG